MNVLLKDVRKSKYFVDTMREMLGMFSQIVWAHNERNKKRDYALYLKTMTRFYLITDQINNMFTFF